MTCTICGSETTHFLSLGHQPPSDAFLKSGDLERPEVTYPLDLSFCPACSLVALEYAVEPDILFRDYVYNSGSNAALAENFKALVDGLVGRYGLTKEDLAVDAGSNDGTLLAQYAPHGVRVLGIDPSSATSLALEKGIPTLVDYFGIDSATRAREEYGPAKIVTATNVFAHVLELDSFLAGVLALLDERGVFVSENGYVVDMVEGMQYDAIYHEHLRYYSVTALTALFSKHGMEIIDVERIKSHGGSIRVHAARTGAHPVSPLVEAMRRSEAEGGFTALPRYETFARDVAATRQGLLEIIHDYKKKGARIFGIGAPAKGNTLLNYCKLDPITVECLVETSPLKIGLYSPGMHIPVVEEARLFSEQPEAALLLSWNLADRLVPKLREKGYRGRVIVPNPVPRVL